MAIYERTVWIQAPLDDVWAFHSGVDGLVELTPDWMHLRIDSAIGPDGESDPAVLEEGAKVRVSTRPLGVGPRQSWTSRIVERNRKHESAVFRDRMEAGPFREWLHTHRFYAEDDGTRIVDRVEYELPLGPFHRISGLARPFFEPMFAYRHRRTKALLE